LRKTYFDILTNIFNNLPFKNEDFIKVLKHKFSYKDDFKHQTNFTNIVLPEILKKTNIAIENAKKLEQHFEKQDIPNHQKSPCTLVHHLVNELLILGKK